MSLGQGFLGGIIEPDLVPECIGKKPLQPFFEKPCIQKIAEQSPARKALAIADTLSQLGFNLQFLGSERYVLNKLQTLKAEDVT